MFKLIHNLAFAMVLYHSLVGCCCHHAHASAGPVLLRSVGDEHVDYHRATTLSPREPASRCCHSEPAEDSDHESPLNAPRGCSTKCVFVVPGSGAAMPMPARCSLTMDFFCGAVAAADSSPAQYSDRGTTDWISPPVRVHLRHQILLL